MYAEGYVDPLYTPYTGDCLSPPLDPAPDRRCVQRGNSQTSQSRCGVSHHPDERNNLDFMRMHADDPCPPGFEQKPPPRDRLGRLAGRDGKPLSASEAREAGVCPDKNPNLLMCQKKTLTHEPVFYTEKAFIAKRQYPRGYGDCVTSDHRPTEPTDVRSVVPCTGQFRVDHFPVATAAGTKYERPYVSSGGSPSGCTPSRNRQEERYPADPNFGSSRYERSATKDSYLA